ncbi:MAG: response regulator receiver/SARP domain-containing protein [Chloroflexi bacterium OLB15]|nr:MAG: response regulator receiver/SARP domain-containing protein [Chloroflexi bacterium OLB15]
MPGINDLLEPILFEIEKFPQRGRFLLLHPDSKYRSLVVAALLQGRDYPVFYYALGAEDINLPSFLTGLIHSVSKQKPGFGNHLLLKWNDPVPSVMVEALAADLAQLGEGQPFILILDEFDRSDEADDIQFFLEHLANSLPDGCTILINSRTVPRLSWISLMAKQRGIMLKDAQFIRENFYRQLTESEDIIEVFALGPGFVLLNDEPIDTWEGHLPRLLFFYALDRPAITRSEICAAFWPDLDSDQAVNVFHVTKRRLHKALNVDVLIHEDGYYHMAPNLRVEYDVADFVSQLLHGRDLANPDRYNALQNALEIYNSPFLRGHSDPWIAARRADFQAGYLEALAQMAEFKIQNNQPEQALRLLQKAVQVNDSQEDLHRSVMSLYITLGRRSEAVSHFRKLERAFHEQGKAVSMETAALYQQLIG